MKALIVGAGGMGRAWGRNLRDCPDVEVTGWVDIAPGRAAEAADECAIARIHTGDDLREALDICKPDFVVDVSVPDAHRDVTVACLNAGLPVLGEKPMADSMEHAREMVTASERSGKLYMVSQSRRYGAGIRAYKRLIDSTTGPLGILNADFYIGAHFGGFRDEMPSPLLLDMAIHTMDQARYLSGADPLSVYCEEFNPCWSWYKGDASANALFEMTGGIRFTYRGSWCAEGRMTSWESEWRAVGPFGTATWDGRDSLLADVVTETGGFHSKMEQRNESPDSGMDEGIAGSLRDFIHALQTGSTPMGECHDNVKSLAMVFAAIESARKGRRIPVST